MEPKEITFCRPEQRTAFWQWQLTKAVREQWFLVIIIVSVLTGQALITIASPWPLKIIFDCLVPDVPLFGFAKQLIPPAWAVDKTTLLTTVIIALV